MNIAVFNTLYYPDHRGGAEISVQLVCEKLASMGHSLTIVSIWNGKSKKYSRHNDIQSHKWPCPNIYSIHDYDASKTGFLKKAIWQVLDIFNFYALIKAFLFFRRGHYDLVWTNNLSGFSTSVWLAASLNNIPVVHTFRDYYLVSNNVMLYRDGVGNIRAKNIFSLARQILLKFSHRFVASYVGISQAVVNIHAAYNSHIIQQCKVIFNPVALPSVAPSNTEEERGGAITYGFMGQANSAKGLNILLEHFIDKGAQGRLVVAGNAPTHLEQQYKSHKIHFLGFVNPREFYAQIDCLLVPSMWQEPFGRVVIEAICHAKPAIVSDIGGLSELARIFKSVIAVKPAEFCKSITGNAPKFCQEDRAFLQQQFSTEAIASKYLSVFNQTIKSRLQAK